ncbi:CU044_5270 family protein [Micromonospora sp. PLK6-60]|uniref:CU044_5270 family protein n=1 Tax=Micromonospora sp. PLK6-60 TaxID=2873383 RepID=UPI001CA71F7E|nr:CU044_5270 family protein [Micromonospora sp. PLK6-60]MBY8871570.1 CU044_5270 family protein [Micromonospora sp. PLK6-60]
MKVDDLVRSARPLDAAGWSAGREGQQVLESVLRAPLAGPARPTRRTARWSLVGTGVIGAAAAVTLVIPALSAAPPQPPSGPPAVAGPATGGPAGSARSAPEILLAAATRAEAAPESGRYWRVRKLLVLPNIRVDGYQLAARRVIETWDPGAATDDGWNGYRDLGVKPATEADERKWKAAGSPTEWNLGPGDTVTGRDQILSTKPAAGELSRNTEPVSYLLDLGGLRLAQVRELPDDPARLRAWVDQQVRKARLASAGPDAERAAFGVLSQLLLEVPAPPKVRAAAFRALADIPGLRAVGTVRDQAGRTGIGLEYTETSPAYYRSRMIIDPDTHLVRAVEEESGRTAGEKLKRRDSVILAAEWSDAKPQAPGLR